MQQDPEYLALPFFRPWRSFKGVGTLHVIPIPAAIPQRVARALARLSAAGLVAEASKGPEIHIVGGTSVSTDAGIPIYKRSFAIFSNTTGGFVVVVSGPGQLDHEERAETLSGAVDAVLRIYQGRGWSGHVSGNL